MNLFKVVFNGLNQIQTNDLHEYLNCITKITNSLKGYTCQCSTHHFKGGSETLCVITIS